MKVKVEALARPERERGSETTTKAWPRMAKGPLHPPITSPPSGGGQGQTCRRRSPARTGDPKLPARPRGLPPPLMLRRRPLRRPTPPEPLLRRRRGLELRLRRRSSERLAAACPPVGTQCGTVRTSADIVRNGAARCGHRTDIVRTQCGTVRTSAGQAEVQDTSCKPGDARCAAIQAPLNSCAPDWPRRASAVVPLQSVPETMTRAAMASLPTALPPARAPRCPPAPAWQQRPRRVAPRCSLWAQRLSTRTVAGRC